MSVPKESIGRGPADRKGPMLGPRVQRLVRPRRIRKPRKVRIRISWINSSLDQAVHGSLPLTEICFGWFQPKVGLVT